MRQLLLPLGLLLGAGVALGGCVVAPAYPPGYYRPYGYGYGYRAYGPPGRYYDEPAYRYGRRPYWW